MSFKSYQDRAVWIGHRQVSIRHLLKDAFKSDILKVKLSLVHNHPETLDKEVASAADHLPCCDAFPFG